MNPTFPRQVTASEVAKLAGVNQSTVSRVINNPELVKEETRTRVQEAIARLNYRPSAQARGLARRRNDVVGLITDLDVTMSMHHMAFVEGVIGRLIEFNYLFTMTTISEPLSPDSLEKLSLIRQNSCDGLVLDLETMKGDIPAVCNRLNIPYVFVNPDFYSLYDCVIPDDQKIAEEAVNYLISKGHRNIAYLNGSQGAHMLSIDRRERGYEMAMLRAKLDPVVHFDEPTPPNISVSEQAIEVIRFRLNRWLTGPHPVTAILTYNSFAAMAVCRLAYHMNLRIPENFSLMACDDDSVLSRWVVPITAMSTNRKECGRQAVDLVFEKMETRKPIPTALIKGELKERSSVRQI